MKIKAIYSPETSVDFHLCENLEEWINEQLEIYMRKYFLIYRDHQILLGKEICKAMMCCTRNMKGW
jgi:hypothetical protein